MPTQDFANEMGFSLRRILLGERDALETLGRLAHLERSQIEEMLSWSGEPLGEVRMFFRGETYVSRALRGTQVRGCTHCLREDIGEAEQRPFERMALRGHWLLKYVHVCLRHGRVLVPLWTAEAPLRRYDCQERFRDILPDVLSGAIEGREVVPTPFETWLDWRLDTGEDDTQMASFAFYAALEVSRLLGTEMLRLDPKNEEGRDDVEMERLAMAAGFAAVSRGERVVADALEDLTTLATGSHRKAKWAFGMLYRALSQDLATEPSFEPFRRMMRDRILRTWPVAAGDVVLGQVISERHLHSVSTAAEEIGYARRPLREALVDAGVISAKDKRPDSVVTFDAQVHAGFLEDLSKLVGYRAMADQMGATEYQFDALVREGIVKPCVAVPGFRAPWKPGDGEDLVARLLVGAVPLSVDPEGWEHIHTAAFRTQRGLRPILKAITSGAVGVGQLSSQKGYRSVYVRTVDIDLLLHGEREKNSRSHQTVAQFEREVGLRDEQRFAALVAAGLTPSTMIQNPASGHERRCITAEDAAAFHEQFVTLSTLSRETGAHHLTVAKALDRAGVRRFVQGGEAYGPLYRRSEIAPVHDILTQRESGGKPDDREASSLP